MHKATSVAHNLRPMTLCQGLVTWFEHRTNGTVTWQHDQPSDVVVSSSQNLRTKRHTNANYLAQNKAAILSS